MCVALLARAGECEYLMQTDSVKLTNYRVQLQARNASLDGVCAIKIIDGSIKGVVVNDFGIKAFAFSFSPDRKKVTLQDVLPMLDHWYIKRVIKNDLKLLFNATSCNISNQGKKTTIVVLDDDTIEMNNNKYNIKYLFSLTQDNEQEENDYQDDEPQFEIDDETAE